MAIGTKLPPKKVSEELVQLYQAFSGNPEMQAEIQRMFMNGDWDRDRDYSAQRATTFAAQQLKTQMMKQQMEAEMERAHQKFMKEQRASWADSLPEPPDPRKFNTPPEPPSFDFKAFEKKYRGDHAADAAAYGTEWHDQYQTWQSNYNEWSQEYWKKPKEKRKQKEPPKPEDITMANKFLPFIVEKSTPEHIYNTLLQRSKGMNINLVTSIFYMVVDKGVGELRDFVKTLPEGMSVTQMYEEMVGQYPHYQIMDEDLNKFLGLARMFSSQDWAKISTDLTDEFDSKDIMAFLYVMYKMERDEYADMDFKGYMENSDAVLANLPSYIQFSDDGTPKSFISDEDLKSYILYNALLAAEPEKGPIRVVFELERTDDPPF